jgi:hypothetical protein
MSHEAYPDALPVGHRLHWYVLEHVLGQGGFGITYLARDTNLDRRVAIKEYLPTDYARRHADATVQARTEPNAERYAWGLERFSLEARTLARFDHPSIVRVHSVFEANNTAYMVMRFEDGENLAHLLERCVTLPERQLVSCLLAILDGLQLVHDAGFIHRDIKPENIYVRADGTPVLLDFGSARQSLGRAKTMTILVAPGYAPLEQYYGDSATQGPWTDLYGLGATCYRAIAGHAPLDAIARAKGVLGSARELLQPAVEIGRGRYDPRLLAAVDKALQLSERDRPQSIVEWRNDIAGPATLVSVRPDGVAPAPTDSTMLASVPPTPPAVLRDPGAVPPGRPAAPAIRTPRVWAGTAAVAGFAAVAGWLVFAHKAVPRPESASSSSPLARAVAAVAIAPVAPIAVAASALVPMAAPPAPAPVPEVRPAADLLPRNAPAVTPGSAAISLPAAGKTPTREPRGLPASPGPSQFARVLPSVSPVPAPPDKPTSAVSPEFNLAAVPVTSPAVALPSVAGPASAATPELPLQIVSRDTAARRVRDEQLAAAEEALRRGDQAAAAELLAPMAAAGVSRAQAMLGRMHEGRAGRPPNYFEAYLWYSMAARAGEPGASAHRDRVASKLQPAEIRQAEHVIERWKPGGEQVGVSPN